MPMRCHPKACAIVGSIMPNDRGQTSTVDDGNGTITITTDFEEDMPTVTLEQLQALQVAFGATGVSVSMRDESAHHESCTIYSYVLVITVRYPE